MRSYLTFIGSLFLGISLVGIFAFGLLGQTKAQAECTETAGDQYCLLEPLPIGEGNTFDKYDGATTTAADYINLIIKVFISIIGVLGVIMIVLGGVQYMTTDAISKKEGGKEMITNSVFGLLLALASWLILNTINEHLLEIRLDPPKGLHVEVSETDELPKASAYTTTINGQNVALTSKCNQTSVNAAAADGVKLEDGQPWGSVKAINDNDAAYRAKLTAVGVSVNKTNCATVGASNCTTVYKLGDTTVAKLGELRNNVCKNAGGSCTLTLTGGTECWGHSSHHIGAGRVDLSTSGTPSLDSYIKSVTSKECVGWISGQASDGCETGQAGKYTIGSAIFIRESDHYHVNSW